MCGDEADLQGWNQSGMPSLSDSDTGTRMIKGPSDAVLYCSSNRLFSLKKSNTELMTGSGFCPESYEEALIDRSYQFVEMPIHRTACFYT